MNKRKQTLTQRANKKRQKELKAAKKPLAPPPLAHSDTLTTDEMLKKYPQKIAKKVKGALKGLEKTLHAKESKKLKKHSKRTNTGSVDQRSAPAHIHPEGERWVKNLRKQNDVQRKRLKKKLLKKNSS